MKHEIQLQVKPEEAQDDAALKKHCATKLKVDEKEITALKIRRRSIDARQTQIKINLTIEIVVGFQPTTPPLSIAPLLVSRPTTQNVWSVANRPRRVIIVGAGPAGLFAALSLLEQGIKPIILERGKTVRDRRRDLATLNRNHIVNLDSNYCFGEGGAGTYSDGKLYTRSDKRGDVKKILEIFVHHGASEEIMIDAHPHIGTNKLPQIIESIRETILNAGGEIYYNHRVEDFILNDGEVKEVIANDISSVVGVSPTTKTFSADAVILATGHSARNIYELLHKKNILLEAKPFAMGVRIEHPQWLIDGIQYHCEDYMEVMEKRKFLPPASYSLVQQINGRGVYSFCMCPGGIIAPCATENGEVVTNGWSPSKRNNAFANSGIVVEITQEDWQEFSEHGVLAGLRYQQAVEKKACETAGGNQTAPAQRMIDFMEGKESAWLPANSYQPGLKSVLLNEMLPQSISVRLQKALNIFGKIMERYKTNEAVVVGVESRTSTPVRIPRDRNLLNHPEIKNLFPCGEGAGYAGGIVSAAMDGRRVAEVIAKSNT